jgi:hypothetical protein
MFADTFTGEFEQILSFPESQGLYGTGFNTPGTLAVYYSGVTHGAFGDPRRQRVIIFICRDLEGACNHAIAAADTYVRVIDNRPFFGFSKRFYKADRCTSRFEAVVALMLSKQRDLLIRTRVSIDNGIGLGVSPALQVQDGEICKRLVRGGKFVNTIAGGLTAPTTDTQGDVVQNTIPVGISFKMLIAGGKSGFARHSPGTYGTTHPA